MTNKIAFTQPHDHHLAGLRDYRASCETHPTHVKGWLVTGLLILFVAVCVLSGCGEARYVADRPHPTHAQIMALAEVVTPVSTPLTELTLRVSPAFVLAGGAVRVTCFVPPRDEYRAVGYGLAGVRSSIRDADGLSYELLIEHVPCGEWTAYCAVSGSGRVLARREHRLLSRGPCNDDT